MRETYTAYTFGIMPTLRKLAAAIPVRLTTTQLAALRRKSKRTGSSVSELMRRAIAESLMDHSTTTPTPENAP